MKQKYNFTILTNKNCNFNCRYCYEKGKFKNQDLTEDTIEYILKLLNDNFKEYDWNFMFIGGEPTLSKKLKILVQEIEKLSSKLNNKVTYDLLTNGSSFQLINNIFENYKDRLNVQVSYDGKPINDIDRIIIKKNKIIPTSNLILKTVESLYKYNYNFHFKSTLNIQYLNLVPEVLKEFRELSLKYNKIFRYSVSEVKDIIAKLNKEEIKRLIKESFPKILQEESINYKIFNQPLSTWLIEANIEQSYKLCSAGINSMTINYNKKILYCHRIEFYKIPFLEMNNFEDYKKINKQLKNEYEKFHRAKITIDENCKNCTSLYCQRCPAENAEINKINNIKDFYSSWQPSNICFYYQEISKYIYYFIKKLKRI